MNSGGTSLGNLGERPGDQGAWNIFFGVVRWGKSFFWEGANKKYNTDMGEDFSGRSNPCP